MRYDAVRHRHRVIASFTTAWTLGLVALFIGYDAARRGNHHGWIAGAVAGTVFLLVGLLSYLVLFPWLSTRQARRSASKMLNDEYAPDTAYHSYGGGSYDLDTGAAKGERLPLLNLKDFGSYTRNPTYTGTSYEDGAAPYVVSPPPPPNKPPLPPSPSRHFVFGRIEGIGGGRINEALRQRPLR